MHWSWLQEMMFTRLPETKTWAGDIVTVIGVKVLTSDFLRILEASRIFHKDFCPDCWSIAMDLEREDKHSSQGNDDLICINTGKVGKTIAFNITM